MWFFGRLGISYTDIFSFYLQKYKKYQKKHTPNGAKNTYYEQRVIFVSGGQNL